MYELFILGELSDTPMHGYLLHDILQQVLGPLKTVSWGTLYPVLRQLQAATLIEPVTTREATLRPKKTYRITPLGRDRFAELMQSPLRRTAEAEDIFRIKRSKFHLVSPDVQEGILADYHALIAAILEGLRQTLWRVASQTAIAAAERPDIFAAIDYEMHSYAARLRWVEAEMAARSGGVQA